MVEFLLFLYEQCGDCFAKVVRVAVTADTLRMSGFVDLVSFVS
jgi:hypothetical protein